MGKVIKKKIQGMSWWAKFSLVALLTLATTVFMYEGWYKPKQAAAAVGVVTNFPTAPNATATTGNLSGTYTIAAGSNRAVVFAVQSYDSGGATGITYSGTYGTNNVPMRSAIVESSNRRHSGFLYLNESDIASATGNTYTITITGTHTNAYVYIGTFSGVDPTTQITGSGSTYVNNTNSVVITAAPVNVNANGYAIYTWSATAGVTRTSDTESYTEIADSATAGVNTGVASKLMTATGTTQPNVTWSGAVRAGCSLITLNPLSTTTPTLSTPTSTSIAGTSATLGANVTSDGGAAVTERGVVWNTSTAPTTANNKVIGTGTTGAYTVSASSLPAGTKIYYRGYAINSVGTSYSPEGSFYTEPATQASGVNFTSVSQTGMTVNWTRGSGAGVIVLMKSGAAVDSPPVDGTDTGYTANAAFGSGTQIGTGNFVLYKGTGTSVAVTGLTNSTTYNVAVYEYSGTGNDASPALGINYLMTPATGAQATTSPCAAATPTALTVGTVTTSSVALSWTAGANDDSYIIYRDGLQKASGVIGTSYTDNTAAAGTTYSYTVSGYNNAGTCGSSQTSPATANTTSNAPAAPTVSNVGNGTSLTVAVNGNGNGTATTYAIRINGGTSPNYVNQFVQAGGTIGGTQVWQTAAAWGTSTINGLSGTYTFDVIARNGALVQTAYSPTAAKAPSVTLSATITTCAGCHGNPPVDNAARVGGTTGQFQGSHNTHSGTGANQYGFACTKCHTDNGTNLAHADGNINIALTPGTYTKGTSFAPNNTTFSGGNCNATYCHSNATGGTSNAGETRAVVSVASPAWGGVATCTTCHAKPPAYTNYTGSVATAGSKANAHLGTTHASKTCDTCHDSVATSDGGATYTTTTAHADGTYTIKATLGYTYNARRGGTCATPGCHGSVNWGGKLGCVDCHSQSYTRTKGAIGATLAAVTAEFGLAYGHKKTGRGAVTDADCIVCHLEGDSTTKKTSATYHQNGTIDLRDPDGTGEARITDIGGASWSFTRFSTSFAAGTRTSTGHTSNTIANIITQKFCLKCHDSNGANNPAARVTGGTAWMPWGGSTGYTAQTATNLNGVPVANGLVNVFSQFSTGNSSLHPVRGPRTKDFPTQARMVAPYNGFTRTGTAGATAAGIVINCFDCHNNYPTLNYLGKTGLLTLRTNAAHGTSGAAASGGMMRGTFYVAAPTLCGNCHSGYTVTGQHGAGSAMASNTGRTDEGFNGQCSNCHGSKTSAPATAPARPIPAADYHGSNNRLTGTLWPTINARPVAFIRGWSGTAYHRGRALAGTSGYAAGTAQCGGGTCPNGGNVGDGSNRNYTPGGTY